MIDDTESGEVAPRYAGGDSWAFGEACGHTAQSGGSGALSVWCARLPQVSRAAAPGLARAGSSPAPGRPLVDAALQWPCLLPGGWAGSLGDESPPCGPRPSSPRPEALFCAGWLMRGGVGRQPDGAAVAWTPVLGKESTASGLAGMGWRAQGCPDQGHRPSQTPRVCPSPRVHTLIG